MIMEAFQIIGNYVLRLSYVNLEIKLDLYLTP